MTPYTQKSTRSEPSTCFAPEALLGQEQALYVEGLGHLDQYGSYVDCQWEKGVVYFVRDYYGFTNGRSCARARGDWWIATTH